MENKMKMHCWFDSERNQKNKKTIDWRRLGIGNSWAWRFLWALGYSLLARLDKTRSRHIGRSLGKDLAYENIFGIFRVGMVVTTWPQTRVPTPKKVHQVHWSKVKGVVEKAWPPYCTMTTCESNQFNRELTNILLLFVGDLLFNKTRFMMTRAITLGPVNRNIS